MLMYQGDDECNEENYNNDDDAKNPEYKLERHDPYDKHGQKQQQCRA